MVQKWSYLEVLKVFFEEPTKIHFIKEISKKIGLAHTSVRKNVKDLLKEKLIIKKSAKPFDGHIANRDNDSFIFYKKIYNSYSLKNLREFLSNKLHPKLAVVFGSYALGEDIETSDIDLLILSHSETELNFEKFEKELKKEINVLHINKLTKLEPSILKKVYGGFVLCGSFD